MNVKSPSVIRLKGRVRSKTKGLIKVFITPSTIANNITVVYESTVTPGRILAATIIAIELINR